jgi:hypothetical protein
MTTPLDDIFTRANAINNAMDFHFFIKDLNDDQLQDFYEKLAKTQNSPHWKKTEVWTTIQNKISETTPLTLHEVLTRTEIQLQNRLDFLKKIANRSQMEERELTSIQARLSQLNRGGGGSRRVNMGSQYCAPCRSLYQHTFPCTSAI